MGISQLQGMFFFIPLVQSARCQVSNHKQMKQSAQTGNWLYHRPPLLTKMGQATQQALFGSLGLDYNHYVKSRTRIFELHAKQTKSYSTPAHRFQHGRRGR